jgi:hypothetical protein
MGEETMTLKLRKLGLVACGVLSLAAVALSAPRASAAEFKCEVENCVWTGFQQAAPNQILLSIGGLSLSCTEDMIAAYQKPKTANELTVTPTVSNCVSNVGSASVKYNHCDQDFTAATSPIYGGFHKTCTQSLWEVNTGGCTIKFNSQTPKNGVRYTNYEAGGKKHIRAETTINSLLYSKSGLTCGFVSGEATLTGSYTVTCYSGGSRAESATTTFNYSHSGSQVNCEYVA